ncbi:MAG: DUF4091 domain-containing protein [Armatimonadetes bacterium]|nr:DUF4091 domain-containing protein [Armatimonadota bacterium]
MPARLLLLTTLALLPPAGAAVRVWSVGADHKLRPDDAPAADWLPARVALDCARDECEAWQLVVRADKPTRDLALVVSELRGPGGARLQDGLEVRRVEWVDLGVPPDGKEPAGPPDLRPDPLPPVDPARDRFGLEPGRNLVFWLTLTVPPNARPGSWSGTVAAQVAGKTAATLRVEARVRRFALPAGPALQSMVGLSAGNLYRAHGVTTPADRERLIRLYFDAYLRARLGPFLYGPETLAFGPLPDSQIRWEFAGDGEVRVDFTGFDREARRYLDAPRAFSAFNFAPYLIHDSKGPDGKTVYALSFTDSKGVRLGRARADGSVNPAFDAAVVSFFRQCGAHFAEHGCLDRAVYYVTDEPAEESVEAIRTVTRLVRQADPRLRTAVTYDPNANPKLGELVEGGRSLISLWIPYTAGYSETVAAEQRRRGADYWLYDVKDYALISHSGEHNRAVFWDVWRRDAHGYLYYLSSWWGPQSVWTHPSFVLPNIGYRYLHGDGYFFYPPQREGVPEKPVLDHLVPSVRWELMREGVEDYEYLRLLERLTAAAEASAHPPAKAVSAARTALQHARGLADGIVNAAFGFPIKHLRFEPVPGWTFSTAEGWLLHHGGDGKPLRVTLPDVQDGAYTLAAQVYRDADYGGRPFSRFLLDGRPYGTSPGLKGSDLVTMGTIRAQGGSYTFDLAPAADAGVIIYQFVLKRADQPAGSLYAVRREVADAIEGLLPAGG